MTEITNELIVDLLVYLDTCVNYNDERINGMKAFNILNACLDKHKEFKDPAERHELICRIIDKLEVKTE